MMRNLWLRIKDWAKLTALPWLKSSWGQIVNIIIIAWVYGATDSLPILQTIVGLWLFVLLAYYIFWKLFGAELLFKKPVK